MSLLFTPFQINSITVRNRLVRSATTSYWSNEEGVVTSPIIKYYEKLAEGGVGLIIKGHSYINEQGKAHVGQSGLCSEKHVPKMKELTDVCHKNGAVIFAQLNHAGYASIKDRVTASPYLINKKKAKMLQISEIEQIIEDFAHSAELALQAGFDGIQIHAAHGYLISQFLSDRVNKRNDKYGGSVENRARLLLEVYAAIRKKVGTKTPVGVKINCEDFCPNGGFTLEQCIQVCKWLEKMKIDFIEISGGGPEQDRRLRSISARAESESGYEEATFGSHAAKIRSKIKKVPLALVDGIRSRSTMDTLLSKNIVDLISMSKPFIIEPDLPKRLEKGQKRSACVDCLLCVSKEFFGKTMLKCHYVQP